MNERKELKQIELETEIRNLRYTVDLKSSNGRALTIAFARFIRFSNCTGTALEDAMAALHDHGTREDNDDN